MKTVNKTGMGIISYPTKLLFEKQEDKEKLLRVLELQQNIVNFCSKIIFKIKNPNIINVHSKCYQKSRKKFKKAPSQLVIISEREILSSYKAIKTNRHIIEKPPEKKAFSLRLDIRFYSYKNNILRLSTLDKRINTRLHKYEKLNELLSKYKFGDPRLFIKNGEIWVSLPFKIPDLPEPTEKLALGIDLGIRRFAATSEGKIFKDTKFNARKRKLRYLKRQLSSCGTKSAKRHSRKIQRKEANSNRNFNHNLSKKLILSTNANVLVIEDLKGIKKKKFNYQKINHKSQISFYAVREMLTYKALLYNKQVITVRPEYTSQIDSRTGEISGERKGCRYYGRDKVILDADLNAAVNIAKRSKLPVSYGNILDGQATIIKPIVENRNYFQ